MVSPSIFLICSLYSTTERTSLATSPPPPSCARPTLRSSSCLLVLFSYHNQLNLMSALLDEKRPSVEVRQPRTRLSTRHGLAALLLPFAVLALMVRMSRPTYAHTAHLHPHTSLAGAKVDWSWLAPQKQCPGLQPIGGNEFTARRSKLAGLLKGEDGAGWGAYISEPGEFGARGRRTDSTETSKRRANHRSLAGPNTLYYANLTQSDW